MDFQKDIEALDKCTTVSDMLKYISENFDIDITPSILTKKIIANGLIESLRMLQAKRKGETKKRRVK